MSDVALAKSAPVPITADVVPVTGSHRRALMITGLASCLCHVSQFFTSVSGIHIERTDHFRLLGSIRN